MDARNYEIAGWLTILSIAIMVAMNVMQLSLHMLGVERVIIGPLFIGSLLLQSGFSIYAVVWFRRLLNRRHSFFGVNTLITLIIISLCLFTCIFSYLKLVATSAEMEQLSKREVIGVMLPPVVAMISLLISFGIIGILYGVKLLRLENSLFGYRKPLAYLYIIGSSMMLTIVLLPLGIMVLMASDVFQALILLKSAKGEPEAVPEYV